jgi:hypothetical protein
MMESISEADRHGQRYMKERLSASALRVEFSKRPCCKDNCMERILKMPRDATVSPCCAEHHFKLYDTCSPCETSTAFGAVEAFEGFITDVRKATQEFQRETPEAKKALKAFLMCRFKDRKRVHPAYKEPVQLCKNSFVAVFGIKMATLNYVQKLIREEADAFNYAVDEAMDIETIFKAWGMDITYYHQHIANFCDFTKVSEQEGTMTCAAFLSDYFDLSSEYQPTSQVKHIDPVDKIEVYQLYIHDDTVLETTSQILTYGAFCCLWERAFPKVVMRKYKSVDGKCHCCEQLVNLNRTCTLRSDKLLIRNYKIMHRNAVIGEKIKYYERIVEAHRSGGKILSFIFDSMSKRKTVVPSLGGMASFGKDAFQLTLMGCIRHADKSTRFYLAYPCVSKGASFMIHCIHSEFKRIIDSGERLPSKVYLQIDGASENTAKAVYGSLEHLVAQGFCESIEVWRLPVGHTHEDIDARFGVISQSLRRKSLYTVEQFVERIHKAFSYSPDVEVVPVTAIYNYYEFYNKFVDSKFSVYKEERTMHGFRIEQLWPEEMTDFPELIVKTNYKKVCTMTRYISLYQSI